MRDHNKYYYVEVALRKDHPAIQNMTAEAGRCDVALSALVKQACIDVYGGESVRPHVAPPKQEDTERSTSVLDQSISSANDFLDNM